MIRAIAIQLFFSAVILQVYLQHRHLDRQRAPQMQLCRWLSASISSLYVRSDKQLSLLYNWHLLNVRQAKYLFSTIFVGTNRDCDVINTLCSKTITWKFFSYVFWQWDQYHLQLPSDLFDRTPINRNPRYLKQIAKNRLLRTYFTSLIRKPRCPTPTRNLGTDMSYQ